MPTEPPRPRAAAVRAKGNAAPDVCGGGAVGSTALYHRAMSLKDDFDARWTFPSSLMTAGIATNRGDPGGALGEALAAGALWVDPSEDVIEWLSWARHLVRGYSDG